MKHRNLLFLSLLLALCLCAGPAAAEAEKNIQYIIRTDDRSAEYVTTDAREYQGYQVFLVMIL